MERKVQTAESRGGLIKVQSCESTSGLCSERGKDTDSELTLSESNRNDLLATFVRIRQKLKRAILPAATHEKVDKDVMLSRDLKFGAPSQTGKCDLKRHV